MPKATIAVDQAQLGSKQNNHTIKLAKANKTKDEPMVTIAQRSRDFTYDYEGR